jgi:hypothetical protein
MDAESTLISDIHKTNNQGEPPINMLPYSELIKQQQPNNQNIQHYEPRCPQTIMKRNNVDVYDKEYQKELILLVCVYVLLHTDAVQSVITSKVPSLYTNNSKQTMVGVFFHAIMLVVIWQLSKHILAQYI